MLLLVPKISLDFKPMMEVANSQKKNVHKRQVETCSVSRDGAPIWIVYYFILYSYTTSWELTTSYCINKYYKV